jgi:nucleoside 2-deoxyribosyltransferase
MKIYLAGGWLEKDTILKPFRARLIDAGITVTSKWLDEDPLVLPGASNADRELTDARRVWLADMDLADLNEADLVWFLLPAYKGSVGSWFEFGYAVHACKPIIVSGDWKPSIFSMKADQRFDAHEQAFKAVLAVRSGFEG